MSTETVGDRMSEHVVTVPSTETLDHAAQVMVERGVGSAVVTEGGKLEGIVTERDVLRAVSNGLVPWTTGVRDCMTLHPMTVERSVSADSALAMMLENGYRHLPVVEDGRLLGIISLRDLASAFSAEKPVASSAS